MKCHIYIFRHGETYYNRSKRFTGRINSRLTAKGIKQSDLIAKKLRNKQLELAFQTSLSRSSMSLEIILRNHSECKRIITDNRMIERSYGDLEGKYHKTVIKKMGMKQFEIWHRSYETSPPGGESFKIIEKRVLYFIEDLLTLIKKEKSNVVISAHNNSMKPFRRYFENLTIKQMMSLENPHTTYFDYMIDC